MKEALNQDISKAFAIIRESAQANDFELFQTLVRSGMERRSAACLVEFLPMAYCRVLLSDSGAQFPETYQRRQPDGSISAEILLSTEPLWEAALEFARAHAERGISKEDLLFLAGRSAEFDAANQMLKSGAKLGDIAFTPTILNWTESGPGSDSQA
jgi:hypothetical protein